MQIQLPTQIVSASLAILLAAQGANVKGGLKGALQAKYDSISGAFNRKDASVFDHVFAPKYVLIGPSGKKIERKELIADYKREMGQMSDITWARTLDNVSGSGSSATVTVRGRFKGTQTRSDGKHVFESVTVAKDTWSRESGSWVLQKSQVLSIDATFDHRRLNRG